jgi:hypothetical protein
LTAASIKLDA